MPDQNHPLLFPEEDPERFTRHDPEPRGLRRETPEQRQGREALERFMGRSLRAEPEPQPFPAETPATVQPPADWDLEEEAGPIAEPEPEQEPLPPPRRPGPRPDPPPEECMTREEIGEACRALRRDLWPESFLESDPAAGGRAGMQTPRALEGLQHREPAAAPDERRPEA